MSKKSIDKSLQEVSDENNELNWGKKPWDFTLSLIQPPIPLQHIVGSRYERNNNRADIRDKYLVK